MGRWRLVFLLGVAVSGIAQGSGRIFTFRMSSEPETLDWNRAHTPIETYVLMNLMEGLVSFDSGLHVVPELAEGYTLSKDKKTYTFKLKPGVLWSDGVPLKARDFVFSWKRLLSPLTGASYAYLLFDISGAEDFYHGKNPDFSAVGIKALDDRTLQVQLSHPVSYWIQIPTFWVTFPLREDIVEKYGTSWDSPGKMVTVGPFTLTTHDFDSKLALKANPRYHGRRGNIDEAIGQIVHDDSTALTLYETGKLDLLTDIYSLDLRRLSSRSDLKVFPYLKTGYLGLVSTQYPLTSVAVRKAIAMAIDKSKLGEILHGGQQMASSFVPPKMMGHVKKSGLPFDPARAREELSRAGIDPSRLTLDLLLPNGDRPLLVGEFLQGQLKKNLGAQVTLQPFDNKTFRSELKLHSHGMFELSWSADYPDPDNFLSLFLSDSGNNATTWKNPAYDALVVSARSIPDARIREKKYAEAQKILLEDQVVIVPLYYEPNMALVKPRVKGLELSPLNYLLLKQVNVDVR